MCTLHGRDKGCLPTFTAQRLCGEQTRKPVSGGEVGNRGAGSAGHTLVGPFFPETCRGSSSVQCPGVLEGFPSPLPQLSWQRDSEEERCTISQFPKS